MPDLDILTLSKNERHFEKLAADLNSQSAPCPSFERVLVNNSGHPGMTAAAMQAGWIVVEPGYNTSFSAGNNMAAKVGRAPWLLLLNDDIRPTMSFLQQLWRQRDTADIIGSLLLHTDGTVNHAGTSIGMRGARTDHIGRHQPAGQYVGTCPLVPAVTFAAVMIERDLWERLGGLDERYYYGWEDTDFCLRAIRDGTTIRCCRDAVAIHDECGTRPRGSRQDQLNARVFVDTWRDIIPDLLASYAQRLQPQTVEGV